MFFVDCSVLLSFGPILAYGKKSLVVLAISIEFATLGPLEPWTSKSYALGVQYFCKMPVT